MTPEEAAAILAKAIADCLKRSGKRVPRIDPNTRVIDGIDGFDSLCGLETTVELEADLAITLEDNIFIMEVDGRPRARTFNQIVEAILRASNGGSNGKKKR